MLFFSTHYSALTVETGRLPGPLRVEALILNLTETFSRLQPLTALKNSKLILKSQNHLLKQFESSFLCFIHLGSEESTNRSTLELLG